MTAEIKYLMVEEILMYCNFAICGFLEFKDLISSNSFNPKHKGIWYQLQTGLANAAIVSSYVFSDKSSAIKRAQYLQRILMLKEDSPLKNKAARNYLTHIDEKFDYCINNSSQFKGIIETVTNTRSEFDKINKSDYFIRRAIIKDEMIFVYQVGSLKKEFRLLPIIDELNFVYKGCSRYLKKVDKGNTTKFLISK